MTVTHAWLILAMFLTGQVPPPTTSSKAAEPLRTARQAIVERETKGLITLADRLDRTGSKEAARAVRSAVEESPAPDGRMRFESIPEVVPAVEPKAGGATSWEMERDQLREAAARDLFDLAVHAVEAEPRHYGIADACLRGVLTRQPDHAEARRLMGQVKHRGGWATPYAVRQFADGKVPHPVFGWVKASWVPHLVKNELPAPGAADGRERWLPTDEADALRRDFDRGWRITTEHFAIQTNVPLAEAIAFGRHLETLHEVFESLLADVMGEVSPLAQRFRRKDMTGERTSEPHLVSYYSNRAEYAQAVRIYTDVDPELSLGYYHPPQARGQRRGRAYFFRDPGGELAATATLFHEGSHMLLFESGVARSEALRTNAGNYWVFEGLGTFFETLDIDEEGVIRVGGLHGPRNEAARVELLKPGQLTPLSVFLAFDQNAFNNGGNVIRHYQQASALASFLLGAEKGRYGDGFLDYVRDACAGRLRRTSGRSLEARLDTSSTTLQAEFLDYLRTGPVTPGK
ncbi:MAG: DUF1570 domain-containing protein [Isosphaeraceae bacterium]